MSENIEQTAGEAEVKPSAPLLAANEIAKEIKPLSNNAFLAFWQGLWRKWLGAWYGFADRHPKLSSWIYKIFFFVVFSQGVTIYQYLLFLFLPQMFGMNLAGQEWLVPKILMGTAENGTEYYFYILGKAISYDDAGAVKIGGGLGYYLAFLIATFTAQCINLPLQRNITFKSKGNVWYQAMWYFIGWILIQPFCDMLGSLWKGLVGLYIGTWPTAIVTLLDTIIMGGVSMVIFFFVFMIIFPDVNKVAAKAQKKYDDAVAANAEPEKLAALQLKLTKAIETQRLYNGRVNQSKTASVASSRAVSYFAVVKNADKAKASLAELEAAKGEAEKISEAKAKVDDYEGRIVTYQQKASDAIAEKYEAIEVNKLAIEEVLAARTARGEDENGKPIKAA